MASYQPGYVVLQYDASGAVINRCRTASLEEARRIKAEWDVDPNWATYHFEE